MIIQRRIPAGRPGTKKLVEQYGDSLVCARYRYDPDLKRMTKTVEILIEERPWEPGKGRIPPNKWMPLRVGFEETVVRKLVKSAGGKWNPEHKYWLLPYREVMALGLKNRMIST